MYIHQLVVVYNSIKVPENEDLKKDNVKEGLLQLCASGFSVHGAEMINHARKFVEGLEFNNFVASDGSLCR